MLKIRYFFSFNNVSLECSHRPPPPTHPVSRVEYKYRYPRSVSATNIMGWS